MNNDRISVALDLDTSFYDREIENANQKLDQFAKQLQNPFKLDIEMGEELFEGVANEVSSEFEKIQNEIDAIQSRIQDKQAKIADLSKKYAEATKYGKDFADRQYGEEIEKQKTGVELDVNEFDQAMGKLENLQNALSKIGAYKLNLSSQLDLGGALPESEKLINNFQGLFNYAGKIKGVAAMIGVKLLQGISKIPGLIKKCISGMISFGSKVASVVKRFNHLGSIIGRIGKSIRQQMITTIASAINPINNFKKAFSYLTDVLSPRLGATFKNIGNNLTEYVANSPAFKNLINDLLYFIKLLEIAFNKLASFLGIGKLDLFKTSAKSAKEMNKSVGSAAKAAKSLAGFDEITNLATNSGGGAGSTDTTPFSSSDLFSGKDLDLSIFDYINEKIYKLRDTILSIDFYELGSHIADGISSFVTKIDWPALVNTVSLGIQGLFKTVSGIWDNLDIEGIGKTISDVFANLDLAGIGTSLGDAIISAFTGLSDLLNEINWSELGTQIANFFLSIDWWGILVSTIKLIGSLIVASFDLIWSFISTLLNNIWNKFSKWFASTPFGKTVIQVFSDAWDMIEDIWSVYEPYFTYLFETVKNSATFIWNQIVNVFKYAWEAIKAAWSVATAHFKLVWENIKAIFSVVKSVLTGDFEGAWNGIKKIWDNAKSYFQTVLNAIKNVFSAVGTFFKNTFTNAVNGIKGAFNPLLTFFNSIKTGFTNILKGILGTVEGFCNKIISGVNKLIAGINKIKFDVPDWVPGIGGKKWGFNLKTLNEVKIPSLNVGTNYVPHDTYAYIHQGEAVIPEKFNDREFFGNDETNELLLDVIDAINNIEFNPYTTIKDVGKTAVDYINREKRVLGRSVV